jgi:hypothetical protein
MKGSFRLSLFRHKIFFEKCFLYFQVFYTTKNICKTENSFSLTKKSFFSFEKWFLFSNFVNHFMSLNFCSNCWTTTKLTLGNRWTTIEPQWTSTYPTPDHSWNTIKPPQTTTEQLRNTTKQPPNHPLSHNLTTIKPQLVHCRTTTKPALGHHQTTTEPPPDQHRATSKHSRATPRPPPSHPQTNSEPLSSHCQTTTWQR